MFADALDKARQFTRPIFQAVRFYDGTAQGGIGACVFVNRDGWFVTAAHMFDAVIAGEEHAKEIAAYSSAASSITSNPKLKSGDRHRQLRQLKPNKKWITNQSLFLADGPIVEWKASRDIDLAVGRIQPFNPSSIAVYPTFKNPDKLRQGTSLCRLGYPFLDIGCTFDEKRNAFDLNASAIAFFPNEGILSREVIGAASPNGPFTVRFVETSSPGLRGQSGGPLIDSKGIVWGIQSHTRQLDLGFNPKQKLTDGREVEVFQFMNVGCAVHPRTIQEYLTHEKIAFDRES